MATSVSKDTSFSSGAISFSALRLKFKKVSSGAVSLSELKRQDDLKLTNPVVPDAAENENIPTTDSNIKLSHYRRSITRYYITQDGTDKNLDIDALEWNGNLDKNIPKRFIIYGTIGSENTAIPAATFDATAYNMQIRIGTKESKQGSIQGAGGAGGTPSSPDGENGGSALYVRSTATGGTATTRKVQLYKTSRIYAGGGGGGAGATGGTGGQGGQAVSGQTGGAGGSGGAGGNGGNGQGYNQTRTNGSEGSDGSDGKLGSNGGGKGGDGGQGGTGGNGGDWGKDGTGGGTSSKGEKGGSAVKGLYFRVKSTDTIEFTIYREAFRQSTISVPGIEDFTITGHNEDIEDTDDKSYDLNAGYYGIITAYENKPPFTPPSDSDWVKIKVSSSSISLDDNQGGNPDGDYQDLVVTSTDTDLGVFGTFSPPAFGVPGRPTNYGSGGSAGTKISGSKSDYIIKS